MKDHRNQRSQPNTVLSRWPWIFPSILCLISFFISFLAAFSTIRWLQAAPSRQPVLFHMQTGSAAASAHTSHETSLHTVKTVTPQQIRPVETIRDAAYEQKIVSASENWDETLLDNYLYKDYSLSNDEFSTESRDW